MADKIQHRRDTITNWQTANPVLLQGEIGVEFSPNTPPYTLIRMKMGDGVTAWNSLSYMNTGNTSPAANVTYDNGDLVLLENTNPVTPLDGVKLFNKKIANRNFNAGVGPSGMDCVYQPSIWRQKIFQWSAVGSGVTAPTVFGADVFTQVGTLTGRAQTANNLLGRVRRLGIQSAATAGALATQYHNKVRYTTGNGTGLGGFFYSCRFAITDPAVVVGARGFVGMTAYVAPPTNVEPTTVLNQIGVGQLSTDATQLYLICNGGVVQTAIPLGTDFPPMAGVGATEGILYDLSIFASPNDVNKIHYSLERVGTNFKATGTITGDNTKTPSSSIFLGHRCWRTNNTTALAVAFDISTVYIETDY